MVQRSVLVFACAGLLSMAGSAVADKPAKAISLDLESFITERDLWDLAPKKLGERSASKFRQGLCKTE